MDSDALRDLLIRWAEINSGSTHLPGLERMHHALADEFRALPHAQAESVTLEGTTAKALRVLIHSGATTKVLLSGHYDTVYGAHHAFQRCTSLEGDLLRGPGVADMKGGIVVMLAALKTFLSGPHASQLGFEVLLTPDEETGSAASRPVIEEAARLHQHACALVFEPARANGDLVRARKGVGVFTITCHGRAAHAAAKDPSAGRNAILALTEYLPEVAELPRDLEGLTVNVANIHGGGAVNIVPDFAEAQVNIRISRAAQETEVLECLRELAEPINQREGFKLLVAGGFDRPPKEVTAVEEALFAEWQRCAGTLKIGWQDVAGGSDGNLIAAAGLPCLDGLGPVGDHLHSPEEFIHLPSLAERAAVASRFFARLATGEFTIPSRRA